MLFRFRYHEAGAHTHVRVFAGLNSRSLGCCGTLVFRNDEFAAFRREAERDPKPFGAAMEFLPDHMAESPSVNGEGTLR
jgi:hypothetical protein